MTEQNMPSQEELQDASALETLLFGLRVWGREMRHLIRFSVARFEISRLVKRQNEEYARLGRIAENPRGKKDEKEQCLKQIAFLQEEIDTLRRELEQARAARA